MRMPLLCEVVTILTFILCCYSNTLCDWGCQIKQMMIKFRSFIEDGNLEGLSTTLSELETLEDTQEAYVAQLETEQMLLLSKIKELGQEIINSSPSSLSRRSSSAGN